MDFRLPPTSKAVVYRLKKATYEICFYSVAFILFLLMKAVCRNGKSGCSVLKTVEN